MKDVAIEIASWLFAALAVVLALALFAAVAIAGGIVMNLLAYWSPHGCMCLPRPASRWSSGSAGWRLSTPKEPRGPPRTKRRRNRQTFNSCQISDANA